MKNQDIVKAILSKDTGRVAEAKTAIKAALDARATQFRADSTKFIAQSLFENVDPVAHHNAASKWHTKAAELSDDHMVKKVHTSAANVHANAAKAHEANSSDKHSVSKNAEMHSRRADHVSSMLAEPIKQK